MTFAHSSGTSMKCAIKPLPITSPSGGEGTPKRSVSRLSSPWLRAATALGRVARLRPRDDVPERSGAAVAVACGGVAPQHVKKARYLI